jgi:hypothetical protein
MERRAFLIFSGLLAALALAGCAGQASQPLADASGARFSEADRKAISGFYEQQGARKAGRVQPLQQAKAGDKLDSGLRPNRLPDELNRQLAYLPEPYTRLTLGADVILVNRNTHDILDVIPQVAY